MGRAEILGAVPLQSRGQPGRRCLPLFKQQRVTAPGRRASPTDGAASQVLTRLQQIFDLATEMWQQSRRHDQIWPPTCDQLPHVWTTWHQLLQIGPQHAADPLFWQQYQYSYLPSAERLALLRARIRTELPGQFSRVTEARREAQARLLKADVEHNHGRVAWKTVREPSCSCHHLISPSRLHDHRKRRGDAATHPSAMVCESLLSL